MPTEKKAQKIAEFEEKLKKCTIAVSTEYRGLKVSEMTELRRKLRAKKIELVVVKNTLVGIAGDKAGKPGIRKVVKGPTAVAFGYGEVTEPAKVLTEHIAATKIPVTITGAVMDGQVLQPADVKALAALPPKPILVGQLMGAMLGPLNGLVYALNYNMGALARVVDGRRKQLEAAQPAVLATTAAPEAAPATPAPAPAS